MKARKDSHSDGEGYYKDNYLDNHNSDTDHSESEFQID